MDQSRRAVESYWRSRMIDGATSDEDKVTPVYKLEEICDLLRSSHVSIVKELSEFVLKRLDHKSPIVKQKALRLIKYAVGKSGAEFRREMQRNSAAVRPLFHYKGKPDPLKGDALNKAVRDTAHEALNAIFSADDSKPSQADDRNKRIQGFGNTNFDMPSDDKKTLLSEVVGIGSATIMQGLNSLTQAQLSKKNDTGNYKSPNLGRSLTTEIGYRDSYDRAQHHNGAHSSSQLSKNENAGPWGQDFKTNQTEIINEDGSSSYGGHKTLEERLLETIVTPGGVRLQPTRDVLQVFLTEASKLDALALSRALESKLISPSWQVRMKAICVLEAILRKKDDTPFSILASYFNEKKDVVTRCSESPQASLREKSKKVLSLLDGQQMGDRVDHPGNLTKADTTLVQMPDLIDTSAFDDSNNVEDAINMFGDQSVPLPKPSTAASVDLFGDSLEPLSTSGSKNDDDPFADVSFHTNTDKEQISVDVGGPGALDVSGEANRNLTVPFDIFGDNFEIPKQEEHHVKDVDDIMAGLTINENASVSHPGGTSAGSIFSESTLNFSHEVPKKDLNGVLGPQPNEMNMNSMFPLGPMAYNVPPGLAFNPALSSQQLNYSAMGGFFTQQQLLAAMANFQQLGNLQYQNTGFSHPADINGGLNASPLPDIFNPIISTQTSSSTMNTSKKEDTRAFDFISDHLAAARDPKRVV